MSDVENAGDLASLWRIERTIGGRAHVLEARVGVPVGLAAVYRRPGEEDVEIDEFECLFLDEALKGAVAEMASWVSASQLDPWDPDRQGAEWRIGRRLGRRRLDLRVDLMPRGKPLVILIADGKTRTAFTIEDAMFLRQGLAALIAEQECLVALGDAAAGTYGRPPAASASRAGNKWEDDDKAVAERLWREGVDVTTIAEHLERTEIAVAAMLGRMGVADREAVLLTSRSVPDFEAAPDPSR